MSKFIYGQKLLTRLDITSFQLFRHVKNGLQPIDRFEKPVPPPDISSKMDTLKAAYKHFNKCLSMLSTSTEDDDAVQSRKALLRKIGYVKTDMEQIEGKYSWEDYELPENIKLADEAFDLLLESYYDVKDVEAIEKANLELSINSEIESVSNPKEKIVQQENISKYLSKAGKKGGEKPKKNQPILLAIMKYLQAHPKLEDKANYQIAESFKRNIKKADSIIVKFNECEWDVYYDENYIWAIADTTNKKKHKDKSISYSTFMNSYISETKKLIKKTQDA